MGKTDKAIKGIEKASEVCSYDMGGSSNFTLDTMGYTRIHDSKV